jgi:hypothetical protein
MSNCSSCGAALADGAAFCAACGKSTSATASPVRIAAPDPERVRQAAAQAHSAVMSLGAEKLTALIGGIVGAIGTLLPFYSIPAEITDVTGGSPSMVGQGGVGWLALLIAVALGALPLVTTVTRMFAIAGFGLAMAVLGVLIGDRTISFMGQSVPIDFGVGFYFAVVGFLVLAYAYGRRANEV